MGSGNPAGAMTDKARYLMDLNGWLHLCPILYTYELHDLTSRQKIDFFLFSDVVS